MQARNQPRSSPRCSPEQTDKPWSGPEDSAPGSLSERAWPARSVLTLWSSQKLPGDRHRRGSRVDDGRRRGRTRTLGLRFWRPLQSPLCHPPSICSCPGKLRAASRCPVAAPGLGLFPYPGPASAPMASSVHAGSVMHGLLNPYRCSCDLDIMSSILPCPMLSDNSFALVPSRCPETPVLRTGSPNPELTTTLRGHLTGVK